MSNELNEVEVETWCCYVKGMVRLILRCNKPQYGLVVKGKPVYCTRQNTCGHTHEFRCYLKAIQIETQRMINYPKYEIHHRMPDGKEVRIEK